MRNQDNTPKSVAETLDACTHHTGFELLPGRAKKVFLDRCLELIREGRMRPVFLDQIVLYANAYESYLQSDESVRTLGAVLQKSGERTHEPIYYANPAVKMRIDSLRDVVRIGRNFSFSPLDRKAADIPEDSPALEAWRLRARGLRLRPGEVDEQAKEMEKKRREEAAITRIYTRYGLKRDKHVEGAVARRQSPLDEWEEMAFTGDKK